MTVITAAAPAIPTCCKRPGAAASAVEPLPRGQPPEAKAQRLRPKRQCLETAAERLTLEAGFTRLNQEVEVKRKAPGASAKRLALRD